MRIGAIVVEPVLDGTTRVLLSNVVTRDDKVTWDCAVHPVDANATIVSDIGGYLVRTQDRVILIDTGLGPVDGHDVKGGDLPGNLRKLGVEFSDVTDVIFTYPPIAASMPFACYRRPTCPGARALR